MTGYPEDMDPSGAEPEDEEHVVTTQQHRVDVKKSHANNVAAWARQNSRQERS
jgi:hypothetical protein